MAPLGGIGRQLLQWLRPPTESVDGGAHSDAVDPREFDDETSNEELDPEEAARDARFQLRRSEGRWGRTDSWPPGRISS